METTGSEAHEVIQPPETFDEFLYEYMVLELIGLAIFVLISAFIAKSCFSKRPIPPSIALAASAPLLLDAFSAFRNLSALWQIMQSEIQGLFHPEGGIYRSMFLLVIGIGQTIILIVSILCANFFINRSKRKRMIHEEASTSD